MSDSPTTTAARAVDQSVSVESLRAQLPSPSIKAKEVTSRSHASFGTWLSVFSTGQWRSAQVIDEKDNLLCVSFTDDDEEDMWIDRESHDISFDNVDDSSSLVAIARPPGSPQDQFLGLANHGNMCFLNSLLQLLYSRPQFRDAVLRTPPANATEQSLMECFQQLHRGCGTTGDASAVLKAVGLDIGLQQDIQQVYLLLMDLMESHPVTECVTGSILYSIGYKGELRVSTAGFHCLSLDVVGVKSLEESLAEWAAPEYVDDFDWDEKSCGVTVTKQSTLSVLPPLLLCHLNRFTLNYDTWATEKVASWLSFPMTLSFREEYVLRGIVVHCGDEASSGHYKAYLDTNNSWMEFNDSLVRPWDVDTHLHTDCFGGPGTDQCAYLLLYEMQVTVEECN
ncbi:hypothetical protein H310_14502 [Aphanomyces invadans]|nr:hypothetical protein H310_14502 [Aphanomyces invadans]ETV90764.1 hypothetical protein H310_14502 [Aphanomyces invadans]|eukprot:XP_008880600.1 hypothetical protein H310_14502 [Aphanomyces invadans]